MAIYGSAVYGTARYGVDDGPITTVVRVTAEDRARQFAAAATAGAYSAGDTGPTENQMSAPDANKGGPT